jgi:hypothetical protein
MAAFTHLGTGCIMTLTAHLSTKRLVFEELEPRALLAADGVLAGFGFPVPGGQVPALFGPTVAGGTVGTVSATGGFAVSGQGSPSLPGFIPGAGLPGGNTGLGFNLTAPEGISVSIGATGTSVVAILNGTALANESPGFGSTAPNAATGVGQMTVATGAGTYGIGSFASPTNGIGDKVGAGGMVPTAPSTDAQNDGNSANARPSGNPGEDM